MKPNQSTKAPRNGCLIAGNRKYRFRDQVLELCGDATKWADGKECLCFLDDPSVPIDNNGTERCLRGVVVGRGNHYGSRSQRATEVAAIFYSLIESTKLAGVGPNTYLRAATMAALRGEPVLLPHQLA